MDFTLIPWFEIIIICYISTIAGSVLSGIITINILKQELPTNIKSIIIFTTIIIVISGTFLGFNIARDLTKVPQVIAVNPSENSTIKDAEKINIYFNIPVDSRKIKVYSYPDNIYYSIPHNYPGNILSIGRKITLVPKYSYPPDTEIILYIADIKSPLTTGYGGEKMIKFSSKLKPKILTIIPNDNLEEINVNSIFEFTISDAEGPYLSHFKANIQPQHPIKTDQIDPSAFIIKPITPFLSGQNYTLTISQIPVVYNLDNGEIISYLSPSEEKSISFKTAKPPLIKTIYPEGNNINPNETLIIEFESPIDPTSLPNNLTLNPNTNISLSWNNDNKIIYINHSGLEKNTSYSLLIPKGLKTKSGAILENDINIDFHTAGFLSPVSVYPQNLEDTVSPDTYININFNQKISDDIIKYINFKPDIAGKWFVENTSATFIPKNSLDYDTKYIIDIISGSQGLYGLPSDRNNTYSFRTKSDETSLNVPFFKQKEHFTCNLAAARMLLAYEGIDVSEADLKNLAGSGGKRGYGDPNIGYIDDYGTYWDPVYKAVSKYKPAKIISSGNITDIINEISNGNPVMIWGQNGWSDPHDISWTTKEGIRIKAVNGMHSSVVRGFRGKSSKPTHILLNDPWRGQYSITTSEFLRRWSFFDIAMVLE